MSASEAEPAAPMQAPVIFSIVSANYLAYAITLMQSVREHHPDALRYVFLADEVPGDLGVGSDLFTLIPVREIGIPHLDHFAFRYSVLEFNTAIKPFALKWLAAQFPSAAIIYLDPDIYVVSPLDKVMTVIGTGALAVVTPHLTAPLEDDKQPDELTFLRVGVYNLGFIGTGPHRSRPALIEWWAEKLEHSAYIDLESGLFTDQRWIDLVPGLFADVAVLRHPGYNLAYWNLPHRALTVGHDGSLLANGEPVSFVHFSGVDVRHPEIFSVHQNRFGGGSIGALRPVYEHYLRLLDLNGYESYSRIPYAWGRLLDGTVITPEMRAIFRNRFDVNGPNYQSNPFAITAAEFQEEVSALTRLSRYILRTYPRLRAHRAFRMVTNRIGNDARWALRRYLFSRSTPSGIRVAKEQSRRAAPGYPLSRPTGLETRPRANVVGYLKGEFGVAEAARSLIQAADSVGVDLNLINIDAPTAARASDLRLAKGLTNYAKHPINVVCVNADQTEPVMTSLGPRVTADRYNIGVWFWELSSFPLAWLGAIDRVDEIWVASEFVRESISSATTKPVRTIGMAVRAQPSRTYVRSEFGLPDGKFIFLATFDFNSFLARKNPMATVAAFRKAFETNDDRVMLMLKSTNGAKHPNDLDRVKGAIEGDPRIRLVDRFLSRDELYGLETVVDGYISLHRSEGFGLGLAESMWLGKPVVATAYSGNLDFMNAQDSCLVGYELVDVKPGEYPYGDGQVWAEPDIEHAAFHLRRLVDDSLFAAAIGRRARDDMLRNFGRTAIGNRISSELSRILVARSG